MATKILFDPQVRDFLRKIDNFQSKRIINKLKEIGENTGRYLENLTNKENSKIRIGNYRLFIDYYERDNKLFIRSIKKRPNAYKK